MGMHQLSQANATILTGFHSASLRHSFISVSFSPPAANYLARRPPTSAAFTLRLLIAHSYLISQSIAKVHLHSSAAYVPFGKFTPAASYGASIVAATWLSFFSFSEKWLLLYCWPLRGARRHFRSFLSPVPYGGSPPALQCGQVCRTAMLLFCRRRFYRQA
jgi:hypothetical protein